MPSTLGRALLCALVTTFAAVPAAHGATLAVSGGTLTYAAAAGGVSSIELDQDGRDVVVFRFPDDTDEIEPGAGCRNATPAPTPLDPEPEERFRCTGVTAVAATAGDRDDGVFAFGLTTIPATIDGGAGNDFLEGGEAADALTGGPDDDGLFGGDGDDRLEGGGGDDFAFQDRGADTYAGGPGVDSVGYNALRCDEDGPCTSSPVRVTLDGQPDDGTPDERDNVGADVEDVSIEPVFFFDSEGPRAGSATLIGSDAINSLAGGEGDDTIDGGAGNDVLSGRDGDDTLRARDGFADRLTCGAGRDTVIVDALDAVSDSCEDVQRTDAGNANEDRPPTVSFTAPAAGAALGGGPAVISATAGDDRGIRQVLFVDDDRVICADAQAPYTCDYSPRGEDVGRNTLSVVAVDTAEQTATATRTVTVPRFAAAISLRATPGRDTRSPYRFTSTGRLALPAAVSPALGCTGVVTVQIKAGRRTISTRRVELARDCTFRSRVSFRLPRRLRARSLRIQATHAGNEVVTPGAPGRATVRVRR